MAGSGSAYQQLNEPTDNISQSLQFWGGQYMNIGKEKRDRDEERRIARDKENKEVLAKYDLTDEDFYTKDTGVQSLDTVAMEANMNAFKSYAEDKRSLQELLAKGKSMFDPEVTRLQMRMSQYKTNAKKMNEVADMYRNAYEAYKKDPNASGANGDFEKQLSAVFDGRMKFRTDENGQLVSLLEVKDDDGSVRVVAQPYSELQHGRMSHISGTDLNALGKNLAETVDKEERKDLQGMFSIEGYKWDERKSNSVRELLRPNLSSNDFMADALYKLTNGAVTKTSGFTDEEKKQVSDFIVDLAEAQFQSKYKKETDSGMVSRANNRDTNATSRTNNRDNNATKLELQRMKNKANKELLAEKRRYAREVNTEKAKKYASFVKTSPPVAMKGRNGKTDYWTTVTLTGKDNKQQPFTLGSALNENGGLVNIPTAYIQINRAGNTIKYPDYKNPKNMIVLPRSKDPGMFELLKSQVDGHAAMLASTDTDANAFANDIMNTVYDVESVQSNDNEE